MSFPIQAQHQLIDATVTRFAENCTIIAETIRIAADNFRLPPKDGRDATFCLSVTIEGSPLLS